MKVVSQRPASRPPRETGGADDSPASNDNRLVGVNALKRKQLVVSVCIFAAFFVTVTILGFFGYISLAAKRVASWGLGAHVVVVLFIIFVSQPYGYGYWISLTAFGYALGWACLPAAYIGFIIGSVMAFLFTKHIANDFVKRKVEFMLAKKNMSVALVAETIRQNRTSKYSLYVSIRHVSISSFFYIKLIMRFF